jgi:hypothetical protein
MEETMIERVMTRWELMRCLRRELVVMQDEISAALPDLSEGSIDRRIALINLDFIRRELFRRDMTFTPSRF